MTLIRDFRSALLRLSRSPGYSLLSIAVLGIGLGAVLFLLCLINGLILRPMPFPDADRLVAIGYQNEKDVGIAGMDNVDYVQIRRGMRGLERTATYSQEPFDLSVHGQTRHYTGCLVSSQLLPLLGASPTRGRGFNAGDTRPGAPLAVLVSEAMWRNDLGGGPDIVGSQVKVNGEPATVIGVMPKGFAFPTSSDLWVPTRYTPTTSADVQVIAKLAAGVTRQQAMADLEADAQALGDALRGQRAGRVLTLKPLALSFVTERTRAFVWLMFAAGALVLLLACANATNLQLGHSLNRQRELAIRSALGASRGRLMREQLLECLVLSIAATLLALGVADLGTRWISDIFAVNGKAPPYFVKLGIDGSMLVYAALAALLATGLSGLFPAWRASKTDVQDVLREGEKGSRGGAFGRLSTGLVIAEIALSVVLLVGAGTFIQGLQRMLSAEAGGMVDPARILTARVTLPGAQYADGQARLRFYGGVAQRLRALPGVQAATAANAIPDAALGSHEFIVAQGQPKPPDGYVRAQMGVVDEQFAATYGIRMVAGRFLSDRDRQENAEVVVVDRKLAESQWGSAERALGQRLVVNPEQSSPLVFTVVGVTTPAQLDGVMEPNLPSLMVPLHQMAPASMIFAIRVSDDAQSHATRLADVIAGVDPEVSVYAIRTQARSISMSRINAIVLTEVFSLVGVIGLLLAAGGLYGVLALSVIQRTREIGIRRAVGASSSAIVRLVGRRVLLQLLTGIGIGVALALPWSAALEDPKLYTQGHDLSVFAVVIGMIALVAIAACAVPVFRALRVDPMVALRYD